MKDNNMTKLLTPPNSPDYHEPSRQSNSAKWSNRQQVKGTRMKDNNMTKLARDNLESLVELTT
jgi:hypothetical protein